MNLFNARVKYTPEIITVQKGKPVYGVVIAEGRTHITIILENGDEIKADKDKCELAVKSTPVPAAP